MTKTCPKEPSPFASVFEDAREGWPVRDCYGLVTLDARGKVLGEAFLELERREPGEANRILALANRLMRRDGNEKGAGLPWIIMSDQPEPTFVVKGQERQGRG